MKLKDLPQPIRELAEKRIREQGNEPNGESSIVKRKSMGGFNLDETEEGDIFWNEIDKGTYSQFYEKYPNSEPPIIKDNPINDKFWGNADLLDAKPYLMKDVNAKHYKATSIEPIAVIDAWDLDFYLGNVIKYIGRAKHKGNELSDLEKAADYLIMKIEKIKTTK